MNFTSLAPGEDLNFSSAERSWHITRDSRVMNTEEIQSTMHLKACRDMMLFVQYAYLNSSRLTNI